MTVAPGHSFNSGAGLLAASGFPTICHDSVLSFNECTFGYVPHAGTTYYANNLKGDFGTFLVLTGIPFSGKDAIRLGIADSLIEIPETYEYEVSDIMESLDTRHMPDARTAGNQNHGGAGWKAEPELEAIDRLKQMTRTLKDDQTELRRREGQWVHDEDFKDPRTRKPDVVAKADLEYKRLLRNFNNSRIDP
jgi:enoyl-CoA hydratase/carnithine racemase